MFNPMFNYCTTEFVVEGPIKYKVGILAVCMAFTIAGLRADAPITILDCANVNTSFPEFKDLVHRLGLALVCEES